MRVLTPSQSQPPRCSSPHTACDRGEGTNTLNQHATCTTLSREQHEQCEQHKNNKCSSRVKEQNRLPHTMRVHLVRVRGRRGGGEGGEGCVLVQAVHRPAPHRGGGGLTLVAAAGHAQLLPLARALAGLRLGLGRRRRAGGRGGNGTVSGGGRLLYVAV